MACNWLMMTSSAAHPRRFGYSHRQNYKKKINRRQSKKPPSLRLRGLKKNKPKAEQETAQPTAARFKKINRRQSKKPPSLRLRGLKTKRNLRKKHLGLREMCPITCLITCCNEANHSQSPHGVTEKRYTLNAKFLCYHILGTRANMHIDSQAYLLILN